MEEALHESNGRFRRLIRRRPILSIVVTSILALLLGAGLGAAGREGEVADLDDQVASLERDIQDAEWERTRAEVQAENARAELVPLRDKVAEFDKQRDDLAAMEDELATQAQDLDTREADLVAAEQTLEANTIPNGTWELGVDFEAGTYRAEGGPGCYWEKLSSPSGKFNDIIANGGFGPNQTLLIDSPYFHTSDCGEWVPVG